MKTLAETRRFDPEKYSDNESTILTTVAEMKVKLVSMLYNLVSSYLTLRQNKLDCLFLTTREATLILNLRIKYKHSSQFCSWRALSPLFVNRRQDYQCLPWTNSPDYFTAASMTKKTFHNIDYRLPQLLPKFPTRTSNLKT